MSVREHPLALEARGGRAEQPSDRAERTREVGVVDEETGGVAVRIDLVTMHPVREIAAEQKAAGRSWNAEATDADAAMRLRHSK